MGAHILSERSAGFRSLIPLPLYRGAGDDWATRLAADALTGVRRWRVDLRQNRTWALGRRHRTIERSDHENDLRFVGTIAFTCRIFSVLYDLCAFQ